jgi:hypothetical protein
MPDGRSSVRVGTPIQPIPNEAFDDVDIVLFRSPDKNCGQGSYFPFHQPLTSSISEIRDNIAGHDGGGTASNRTSSLFSKKPPAA